MLTISDLDNYQHFTLFLTSFNEYEFLFYYNYLLISIYLFIAIFLFISIYLLISIYLFISIFLSILNKESSNKESSNKESANYDPDIKPLYRVIITLAVVATYVIILLKRSADDKDSD